jgi:hypothetical protein
MRIGKRVTVIVLILVGVYVGVFAVRFEIFDAPVRNNRHGWLGPRVRGDSRCLDIGKVWYREDDDISDYNGVFRPLCRFWVFANGL